MVEYPIIEEKMVIDHQGEFPEYKILPLPSSARKKTGTIKTAARKINITKAVSKTAKHACILRKL